MQVCGESETAEQAIIITRLKKQPFGHVFKEYTERNLLDHIASKRDYYLSCVWLLSQRSFLGLWY
jgi:hypothetical protein